jgi:hypothetical protein
LDYAFSILQLWRLNSEVMQTAGLQFFAPDARRQTKPTLKLHSHLKTLLSGTQIGFLWHVL